MEPKASRPKTGLPAAAGPVDILLNAGIIKVVPFSGMAAGDFEQAFDVSFWGTPYSTLAVLPLGRERRRGSSVPRLLPYSCAKLAADALADGLRSELAPAIGAAWAARSIVRATIRGDG